MASAILFGAYGEREGRNQALRRDWPHAGAANRSERWWDKQMKRKAVLHLIRYTHENRNTRRPKHGERDVGSVHSRRDGFKLQRNSAVKIP